MVLEKENSETTFQVQLKKIEEKSETPFHNVHVILEVQKETNQRKSENPELTRNVVKAR